MLVYLWPVIRIIKHCHRIRKNNNFFYKNQVNLLKKKEFINTNKWNLLLDLADVRLILHIYKYLKTYLSKTVMKWVRKKILSANHSHEWNIKHRTFVIRHFIQNFDRYFDSKIKVGCQQVSFSKTMLDIHYPSTFAQLLLQFFLQLINLFLVVTQFD